MALSGDDAPIGDTGSNEPKIRRARVGSVSLYEITDYELGILEKGSPSSTMFNLGTLFFSIGISFLITILSTEIKEPKLDTLFTLVAIVGIALGVILFILWYRTGSEVHRVCKKIRSRMVD